MRLRTAAVAGIAAGFLTLATPAAATAAPAPHQPATDAATSSRSATPSTLVLLGSAMPESTPASTGTSVPTVTGQDAPASQVPAPGSTPLPPVPAPGTPVWPWLLIAVAAALLAALVAARALTSPPGKHRAGRPARPTGPAKAAEPPDGPQTPRDGGNSEEEPALDGNEHPQADRPTAEQNPTGTPTADAVDAVGAAGTDGPSDDTADDDTIELERNPATGRPAPALRPVPNFRRTGPATRPARRAGDVPVYPDNTTVDATADDSDIAATSAPAPLAGPDPDSGATAAQLQTAWQDEDVDALAAIAHRAPGAAFAAHVLAALAAARRGDRRGIRHLQLAFLSGSDPETDPLLTGLQNAPTVTIREDRLGLNATLPCTRAALGCALACAEMAVADGESAYSILLELADSPLVCALRAQATLDIQWPTRALAAVRAGQDCTTESSWRLAFQALHGTAELACGHLDAALELLTPPEDTDSTDTAVTNEDPGEDSGAPSLARLRSRMLFDRGRTHLAGGNPVDAWADLTEAADGDDPYPGAADLLATL